MKVAATVSEQAGEAPTRLAWAWGWNFQLAPAAQFPHEAATEEKQEPKADAEVQAFEAVVAGEKLVQPNSQQIPDVADLRGESAEVRRP